MEEIPWILRLNSEVKVCASKSGPEVDGEVIEGCRQGDREAFRLLYEAYKDRVYSVALNFFGGDEATAKDTAQQVFLKLIDGIGRFQGRSEFSTWLYRIVVNTCIDRHRSGRPFVLLADLVGRQVSPAKWPQEDGYLRNQVHGSVQMEIAKLPPKLRLPILLRYFEDLSYEEIARILNCSAGTVASRLNRGHKTLAKRLAHLRGVLVRGG